VQNGKKDPLETCDPTDMTHQGRGSKGCSAMCQPLSPADTENPDCDGVCGVNDCNVCLSDCDKTDICLAYCIPNGVRDAGEVCDPSEAGCNAFCQRITPPSGCDGVC
jgi:hypothetical protein